MQVFGTYATFQLLLFEAQLQLMLISKVEKIGVCVNSGQFNWGNGTF